MSDVIISDQGTIVLFTLTSPAARDWFDENVQSECWQWLGQSCGIEHRYAGNLIDGLHADGLIVEAA